jgi:hypothetical protein
LKGGKPERIIPPLWDKQSIKEENTVVHGKAYFRKAKTNVEISRLCS